MARARNVKPAMFKNEILGVADPLCSLLFVGLWTLADREGRLEDRPVRIKAELFPYRDGINIDSLLMLLHNEKFIVRYAVGDGKYIQVIKFLEHQNPHQREAPSAIPPMSGAENRYVHQPVTEEQRQRIFERDEFTCRKCGSTRRLHCDHVVPISKGGSSEDSNLQTLCAGCNLRKSNNEQAGHEQGSGEAWPKKGKAQPLKVKAMSSPADSLNPLTDSLNPHSAFADAWAMYPKRSGSNPKRDAEKSWNARVKAGGIEDVMLQGVRRYRAYCEARQIIGTEFVMQAKRFFGPSEPFAEGWEPPKQPGGGKKTYADYRK